jgi:hypothetical protein
MFIMSSHPWCMHDIHLVHVHAIGVLGDVTSVEFERTCLEEQEPAQGQEA